MVRGQEAKSDCCRRGQAAVHITKMYPTDTPNLWGFCQIFHDSNKIQKHYIPHFKDLNSDISALNENGFSMNPKLATLI